MTKDKSIIAKRRISNNIKVGNIIAGAFFLLLAFLSYESNKEKPVLGVKYDLSIDSIVEETNRQREIAGLEKLSADERLMKAAKDKIDNMLALGYWDHESPKKLMAWSFILNNGYDYHLAGENLAKDFFTNEELMTAWMKSLSHRGNIMNPKFKNIGVAIANGKMNGEETLLVVQMFAAPFEAGDLDKLKNGENLTMEHSDSGILGKVSEKVDILSNDITTTQIIILAMLLIVMIDLLWGLNRGKLAG